MNIALIIVFSLIALFVGFNIYNFRKIKNTPAVADNDKIIHLTKQNFDNQIKKGLSLVDFFADWCMPCKMMAPILNDVANETEGVAKICKIDVQKYPELSARFGVKGIPSMILFLNGKEINRFVGVKNKEFLINQINQSK